MANIKFIGRTKELQQLEELSQKNFFLIVKGRRRIGKTSLLRKAFPTAIYLFIWPDKSMEWILKEIYYEYKVPEFRNFGSLLEYLFEQNHTVIIDEFQNFLHVDKSVYGEIQKILDERKIKKKRVKLAVAGSSYSLMNKVFADSASPLYGRKTHEINLDNIDIRSLYRELNLPLQEFIELWSVFEGVPYYYEFIDQHKSPKENIFDLVLSKDAQLREEGKAILSIEFGKDSKTYNTVLTAISEGKTKLNEISSLFDNKSNEVIKYLDFLRREFNLVRRITPITENPTKSRVSRYEIIDNFLTFWFNFYDRKRSFIEQERFEEVNRFFIENSNAFFGKKFEKFIINLLKDRIIFPEKAFTHVGNQWGKHVTEPYEIDILAMNNSMILYGECKWKDLVNGSKIIADLAKKAEYVGNKDKKEILVVFAKSFTQKITEFQGKEVHCFDLKDISSKVGYPKK